MSAPRSFRQALEENPAPARTLGDVSLRHDPPLLVGETAVQPAGHLSALALALAGALDVVALAGFLLDVREGTLIGLVGLAAAGHLFAAWSERRDKRQRRFVCNFADQTLRLDYQLPLRGLPRTLLVDFAGVRAIELLEDPRGGLALVVDFVPAHATAERLREVLVAQARPEQRAGLERLRAVLRKAVGLEPAPAPEGPPPAADRPEDLFVPP